MNTSTIANVAGFLALSTLTIGCGTSHSQPRVEPASAPGNNPCAQAQFSPQQFTGDWTEPGDTTVTTLGSDGTLKARGNAENRSGTWSYTPWDLTPGKAHMPTGEAERCVVWLHWTEPGPVSDLVYVPLEVSDASLQLSYVGRGNTVTWVRPAQH